MNIHEEIQKQMKEGELVFIEGEHSRAYPIIGIVGAIHGDSMIQLDPGFRLYVENMGGQRYATIQRLTGQQALRTTRSISNFVVGQQEVAQSLRKIDPEFESYACKIEKMIKPYYSSDR